MRKIRENKYILPILLIILIILVWEFGVNITSTPVYILPSPSDIGQAFISDFARLINESLVTLSETVIGMSIAVLLGMAVAFIMDKFGLFKNTVYPLLVVSQAIPVIVLAPLFIIYLGFGMAPKILTVVLMCFFPIAVTFADGLAKVDQRLVNLAKSYGAGSLRIYGVIKIPATSSSLFSGMKIAATYSVTGAVVGEWLASNSGLGYYMLITKNGYMLDKMFASIFAVVVLSLMMNGLVRLIKYILLPSLRKGRWKNENVKQ